MIRQVSGKGIGFDAAYRRLLREVDTSDDLKTFRKMRTIMLQTQSIAGTPMSSRSTVPSLVK